jgi:hypothetical protein
VKHSTALSLLLPLALGCNPAVLTGPPPPAIPQRLPPPLTVVIEPFFDTSGWKTETHLEPLLTPNGTTVGYGTGYGGYGAYGPYGSAFGPYPDEVAVTVQVKNVFNRVDVLAQEHAQILSSVARMRPRWRVESTAALQSLDGPVTLVRVVVGESEVIASDRSYKTTAFIFGIFIPPLLFLQIGGVDESQRVFGLLDRYEADALQLRPRLLRYPTQPDFAVDTRGLPPTAQPFGIELSYNEGVNASASKRDTVLVQGFIERLATAIVALVEGVPKPVASLEKAPR